MAGNEVVIDGKALNNLSTLVNTVGEITRIISEYTRLISTIFVYPIKLPTFDPSTELYRKLISKFNDLASQTDFGEVAVVKLSGGFEVVRARPRVALSVVTMKTEKSRYYGEEFLTLEVRIGEKDAIYIPLAGKYGGSPVITMEELARIAVLAQNEDFVKKVVELLGSIEREYAEMLNKATTFFSALRILGIETSREA